MDSTDGAFDRARRKQKLSESSLPGNIRQHKPVDVADGFRYHQTRSVKVSKAILRSNRIICDAGEGGHLSAYKFLRTKVLQTLRSNNWNTLGITSPGPEVGKTVTAINLAINIAMEVSKTVLLVDADLRRPAVHKYFGLPINRGLGEYLSSGEEISNLLIHPDIGKLVLLPGGRSIVNSSEMLGSPQMGELVEELKTRYPSRIVLFDLPPVLAVDDVLAFAPSLDAILLVAESGKTRKEELIDAYGMLENATNVIGTVLNKASSDVQTYGYY